MERRPTISSIDLLSYDAAKGVIDSWEEDLLTARLRAEEDGDETAVPELEESVRNACIILCSVPVLEHVLQEDKATVYSNDALIKVARQRLQQPSLVESMSEEVLGKLDVPFELWPSVAQIQEEVKAGMDRVANLKPTYPGQPVEFGDAALKLYKDVAGDQVAQRIKKRYFDQGAA